MDPKLSSCPFCGGEAKFMRKKGPNETVELSIVHYPESGVVCPARWEAVCDTVEIGAEWWNKRVQHGN
jgi:hypothetical protein